MKIPFEVDQMKGPTQHISRSDCIRRHRHRCRHQELALQKIDAFEACQPGSTLGSLPPNWPKVCRDRDDLHPTHVTHLSHPSHLTPIHAGSRKGAGMMLHAGQWCMHVPHLSHPYSPPSLNQEDKDVAGRSMVHLSLLDLIAAQVQSFICFPRSASNVQSIDRMID